ncbi:MAG TPA: flagellar biogenesis protein [Clostridiaceae bacterium]|nr:flagellar biogenesis protein [Clostridiaceae bacterium]
MNKTARKKDEKIKEAVALSYSPDRDYAPRIIAKGSGYIAEKIVETAKNANVPVYQDAELAQTLNSLSIGDEIPSELYEVVAQILVFIGYVDREFGERNELKK